MGKRSRWDAAPTKAELAPSQQSAGGKEAGLGVSTSVVELDPDTSHLSDIRHANLSPDPGDKFRVEKWTWAG